MYKEEYFPPDTPEREVAIRRRVHRMAEFYQHLFIYLIVNGLMVVLNAFLIYNGSQSSKWYSWWVIWPILGWGIGLLTHGITVLPVWGFFAEDWEDRKVKEILEREKK